MKVSGTVSLEFVVVVGSHWSLIVQEFNHAWHSRRMLVGHPYILQVSLCLTPPVGGVNLRPHMGELHGCNTYIYIIWETIKSHRSWTSISMTRTCFPWSSDRGGGWGRSEARTVRRLRQWPGTLACRAVRRCMCRPRCQPCSRLCHRQSRS